MTQDFHVASKRRYVMRLKSLGTLTTGDDKDSASIPFREGRLIGGVMAVRVSGTSSGNTGIMIERNRDEDNGNNMLSAVQEIAEDATILSKVFGGEAIVATGPQRVLQGDQVVLNIDEVPTAAKDLTVDLIFQIIEE